jgi:hypothetical protein
LSSAARDEYRQARNLAREFRALRSYQRKDRRYSENLRSDYHLVRLEILSAALEDLIHLTREDLIYVVNNGEALEKAYATLILCRNYKSCVDDKMLSFDLEEGSVWTLACKYAADQSLTNYLRLLSHFWEKPIRRKELALNLAVTIGNAVHRIVLSDILKLMLESRVLSPDEERFISRAKRSLNLVQSRKAISRYKFTRTALAGLLR